MQKIQTLHCEESYEILEEGVLEVKKRKRFLDFLNIPITDIQFEKFLSLYAFPLKLRDRVIE